jgi:signal transduction histidine kinase/CheY-like chemotaxis protein
MLWKLKDPAFTRFSVLCLVVIVALALGMGYALSSLLTRAVSDWEWQNTAALVRREVRIAGLARLFVDGGGARGRERWADFQEVLATLPEVVRVKIWSRDAEILWSDEAHIIGRRFPGNTDFEAALAGEVRVEIKALRKSEQTYERLKFDTLAEIYVPILGDDGGVVGVVEVYKTPERLLATIRWGGLVIWVISLSGGALLYGVLLPLLTQVYRRQVEEETVRAHAARLEAEVEQRTHELLHAQKMQAVGLLAGGIAHDFNNLLTVIIGRTEVLRRREPADSRTHRDAGLILEAAESATNLTRQLLAFSRKQILERRLLDLNGVVADMTQMLRQLIGEHINVVVYRSADRAYVNADRAQLQQVVLNLVVNARDAMPHGGTLTLSTTRANGSVELVVTDTGIGMDAATQQRIFEPFFTTKEAGKGTGLGLSTVYGVVQQHGGRLSVDSAPGRGTTFRIVLPEADPAAVPAGSRTGPTDPRGSETILVVEDEPQVRALACDVLIEHGYTVLVAENGAAALALAAGHRGPIHLLLTDIVMPEVGGREVARRMPRTHPEARTLFMTGYTDLPADPSHRVMVKPFTSSVLVRAVREALDAPLPVTTATADEPEPAAVV